LFEVNGTAAVNGAFSIGAGSQAITFTPASGNSANLIGEIRIIPNYNGSPISGGLYGCNERDGLSPAGRCLAFDRLGDSFNEFAVFVDGTMQWGPGTMGADNTLSRLGNHSLGTDGSWTFSGVETNNGAAPEISLPGASSALNINATIAPQVELTNTITTAELALGSDTADHGSTINAQRTDSPFIAPLFVQNGGGNLVVGKGTDDGAPVQFASQVNFEGATDAIVLTGANSYITNSNGSGTVSIKDGAQRQLSLLKTGTTSYLNLGVNSSNISQISALRVDSPFQTALTINPDGGDVLIATTTDCGSTLCVNGTVAIGNAVNVVSPTSPNRTITMVVGGTTLYIAAKTTDN